MHPSTSPTAPAHRPPTALERPLPQESVYRLLEALPEGVTIQAADGRIVFANAEAAKLMGFVGPDEVYRVPAGRLVDRFEVLDVDGARLPVDRMPSRIAFTEGRPADMLLRFRVRATGEERCSMVTATPQLGESGNVAFVMNVFRDVTEQWRSQRSTGVVARAGEILSKSIDPEETLAAVAKAMVPVLGDWCAVELADVQGAIRRVACEHVDPEKVQLAEYMRRRWPPRPDDVTHQVMRTGKPVMLRDIPERLIIESARDDEHRELALRLGLRSFMVVPLTARGRTLGAVTLVSAESGRLYDEHDLQLAMDVANRAALAVDNARLLADARGAAERLELALEAGRMGTWEWDIAGGKVSWSPQLERIHGLAPGSFDGSLEMYRRGMHPDDRAAVTAATAALLEEKRSEHHLLYRIVRADGEVRWVEAFGRLVLDEAARPLRLVGVTLDVTERRAAEVAARGVAAEQAARVQAEAAEQKTRAILTGISDPFLVLDAQWRFSYVNEAAARIMGASSIEQVQGYCLLDVPGMREREDFRAYERVRREKVSVHFEEHIPTTDKWVEVTAYPAGEGVAVYFRDITERREADAMRELAAQRDALRAEVAKALSAPGLPIELLAHCCAAIRDALRTGAVLAWGFDRETQAVLCRAGVPAAPPPGLDAFAHEQAAREPSSFTAGEFEAACEWAKERQFGGGCGAPLSVNGVSVGYIAAFGQTDRVDERVAALRAVADLIAQGLERRRAEAALEVHARELTRSNGELQQFAYVASHDLQEPLRMVASYTQLLARRYRGKLDKDADEFIGYAVDGVARMQTLINDLLTYSRVGTRGKDPEATSSAVALERALANLKVTTEQEGARVTHDAALPQVIADAGQLVQVFQNLVANGIKFKAQAPPEVHVGVKRDGDAWEFTVKDNGIGIAPEYFDRVFVIFQRLHTRSDYPGNGIGLAICKKIIERHRGRIWIESTPGQGSTFHFTLPAAEKGRS